MPLCFSDEIRVTGDPNTGGKVVISARSGSKFRAFDGMLRGRTLYTVSGQLIVQAWRSSGWKKGDLDSTLILRKRTRNSVS